MCVLPCIRSRMQGLRAMKGDANSRLPDRACTSGDFPRLHVGNYRRDVRLTLPSGGCSDPIRPWRQTRREWISAKSGQILICAGWGFDNHDGLEWDPGSPVEWLAPLLSYLPNATWHV